MFDIVMIENRQKILDRIIVSLKKQGASAAVPLAVSSVVVDERVLLKCQIPLCDSYRRNLMCPPYVPEVAEFKKTLVLYSSAILLQVSSELKKNNTDKPSAEIFSPANKLHELVNVAEKTAFTEGVRFAAGLIGGCCRLCAECVAVRGGNQCRFPFKARPSMEALGIDVLETAAKAGLPLSFPISRKVTWTGLILME